MYVCCMGGVLLTTRRCGYGEHARLKRHREGQGAGVSKLRAAGDVFTTAEGNGKTG